MKIGTSLAGELSGSMGSMTASHNRAGTYLRRKRIPTNPNTHRQQSVRATFGALVQYFTENLDSGQREAWAVYGAAIPRLDPLGNPYTMTGQQAFIGSNSALVELGLPIVDDAPAMLNTGTPPEMQFLEVQLDGNEVILSGIFAGGASADGRLLFYIGRQQNLSRTFYKGPYQLAYVGSIVADSPTWSIQVDQADSAWRAEYPVTIGTLLPVRLRMQYEDGRLSQAAEYLAEVVSSV